MAKKKVLKKYKKYKKFKRQGGRGFLNPPSKGGMAAYSWTVDGSYCSLKIHDCTRAIELDFDIKHKYKNMPGPGKTKQWVVFITNKQPALCKIEKLQDVLEELKRAIIKLPAEGVEE